MKEFRLLIAMLFFALFSSNGFSNPSKIALVIGNGDYKESPLKNPVNDSDSLYEILQDCDFDVMKKTNANQKQMEDAISEFCARIKQKDVALFYFGGHGIQVNGTDYLIPIESGIDSEDKIKYKSVDLNWILDKLEKTKSSMNIIILDACRSNPFRSFSLPSRGLAQVYAPKGTIIAYSTAPGKVAYDAPGPNSPYTKHLIQVIRKFNLKIEETFKQVRKEVMKETNNKQIPWESTSLIGDFNFCDIAVYSEIIRPEFHLPEIVKGYVVGSLSSYMDLNHPSGIISRDSIIQITFELFDNNIIEYITPLFFVVSKRTTPTSRYQTRKAQYEINPGKNIIMFPVDFPPDVYEIELGFYFKSSLKEEYPTFYRKEFQIEVIEN